MQDQNKRFGSLEREMDISGKLSHDFLCGGERERDDGRGKVKLKATKQNYRRRRGAMTMVLVSHYGTRSADGRSSGHGGRSQRG